MALALACDKVLNFNIGILGHVDSGKTSLSKSLSTIASTACFDKNPQSKERGITLDLGFSSFTIDCPEDKRRELGGCDKVQYTLVDCPGHASLIRTIIGGAQIIDLMVLVVDIVKGMQTQTAECLIIGEITCSRMIVVLNKIDMIPEEKRVATIEKMKKRMLKTLEPTRFAGSPVIAVSAKPGGQEAVETEAMGVSVLVETIQACTSLPLRKEDGPFIFSLDHCFSIRGQGTVMTGTALSGKVSVNDTIEIPALATTKKVKSMQMFRKPINTIKQGDRAGICVTQFDPSLLERGLVCSPGAFVTMEAVIVAVNKISYYKNPIKTKSKFHITLGHETVMGRVHFFYQDEQSLSSSLSSSSSNTKKEKKNERNGTAISNSPKETGSGVDIITSTLGGLRMTNTEFDFSKEYRYSDELFSSAQKKEMRKEKEEEEGAKNQNGDCNNDSSSNSSDGSIGDQFALIELEKPVTCSANSLIIGSRLDADVHTSSCRIAFHGVVVHAMSDTKYKETVLPSLKVFKTKVREGLIERANDRYAVIGKSLFKKETNIEAFSNLRVVLSSGERGIIEGGFGQSGKVKIRIPDGLCDETFQRYSSSGKKKGGKKGGASLGEGEEEVSDCVNAHKEPVKILLNFKRYVYDPAKKMIQS